MSNAKSSIVASGFAFLVFLAGTVVGASAQDMTHPPTTKVLEPQTHEIHTTHVKNATIIHVSGHEIVVELENGKLELLNLPDDFKFQVDGKEIEAHELTPGTKISQEIHTVTTPQEVTTLRTVNGKVWYVAAPHLILSFPDGQHKSYTVPKGIVFHIDGKDKTVFDLKKGMTISATVLKVQPVQQVTMHTVVTGETPPKPTVAFEGPMLLEEQKGEPAVVAELEEQTPKELPKTASLFPLTGLLGVLSLVLGAGLTVLRKRSL